MKKITIILLLFLLSITVNAQEFFNYGNLCLAKMDSIQSGTYWSRARALDFDKDGKQDFAIIDKGSDSLEIFFNNGAAKFTAILPLKIFIGTNAKDLCVGDFDGDSFTDIATINYLGDLSIFKNVSGTGISLVNTYSNTTNPNLDVQLIECGDLNNDSKPDIIGTGKDYSTSLIQGFTFQNTLSLTFGPINIFPLFIGHTAINAPYSPIAIADFNGDSFNDFVVGTNDVTDTLEIYPNLGLAAITFSSPTIYKEPLGSLYVESVMAKDFDGDSKPDIAIASGNGFSINKNLSGLNFSSIYSNASMVGTTFEFKDINADTYPDLVMADWSGAFYVNKGTNSQGFPFGTTTIFYVGDTYRFLLEEFDGNAIPDFVFVGGSEFPDLINLRNFSFHVATTIVSTNTAICGSTPVNFLATNSHSTYPGTYSWTPGPGTGFTYTATAASAVSCAFSFTLPPGYGQCTLLSDTINITSQSIPIASISASVSPINCAGTPVNIIASIVPATSTYTWSNGSTVSVIVVSPTTTTTYSLFMDNGGCPSTATYSIYVNPNPTVNITAPTTSICTGGSLTLTGTGATSYTWFPTSTNSTTLNVQPTATTVYSLVGSDSFGCKDTTSTIITVSTPPTINITASKPIICFPDTVTLTAFGASTYTWSTGAVSNSVTLLVFANGNYSVGGSNGCFANTSYSVTGLPRPLMTAIASKPTVCDGDSVTLQVFGALTYTWSTFQFTNSIFTYPTASTTYSVLGLGTNGCYNYTTVSVGVGNSPGFEVLSSELCVGKTGTIYADGANTYTWSTGSTSSSITVTPMNSSPLSFTVVGADLSGCKATVIQDFNISSQCQLIVFNGMTPNGDGQNDFFRIENIEQYPGNVVMIYNRWGQKLDEITNYDNNNNFWSGTNNGKLVPSGTYYFVIDLGNNTELIKGYIELTKKDTN